ncbi:VgrG protein [Candidatus Paraburkholderia kirkii]|nr:VgrG protein [Candidatus Paraburkholderia kirkii]
MRFFYDLTIPEVLMQVLEDNGFDQLWASFEFLTFHYTYRKHPIITQWEEDDLTFLQRLCRRSGIWFVCEAGEHCEVVVFGDDLTHYLRDDSYHMPYRPESGMHDGGVESVETLTMRASSIPRRYFVRSYAPENGYEPIDAGAMIHDDETTYGEAYTYGLAYQTRDDAADEARLRQQAALCSQIRYEGETNKVNFGPRYVMKLTNRDLADAEHGLVIVSIHVGASRKQGYKVRFTAIPNEVERPYRMPLMQETWPRIVSTITGTIKSPDDYAHPFITERGGYVVQIHADRDGRETVRVVLQSTDPQQLKTLHQVLEKLEVHWLHPDNRRMCRRREASRSVHQTHLKKHRAKPNSSKNGSNCAAVATSMGATSEASRRRWWWHCNCTR